MNVSRIVYVAVTVARNRTDFYFSQRLRYQKNCETCSLQGVLHNKIASCKKNSGVIAPLALRGRNILRYFYLFNDSFEETLVRI